MRFAFEVLVPHTAGGRTIDIREDVGHRQAPFLIARQLFRRVENFRIDEDPRLFDGRVMHMFVAAVIADLALGFLVFRLKVDHQYTLGNADLDRRQPDAGCRIHRFEHVRDELVQLVVEFGNRFGHGFEPGIRHFENLSYRHGHKICASRRLFNLNRAHTVIGQPIGLRARSA